MGNGTYRLSACVRPRYLSSTGWDMLMPYLGHSFPNITTYIALFVIVQVLSILDSAPNKKPAIAFYEIIRLYVSKYDYSEVGRVTKKLHTCLILPIKS